MHLKPIRRVLEATSESIIVSTEMNGDGKLHKYYQWVKIIARQPL
jgi:hypothetical protein